MCRFTFAVVLTTALLVALTLSLEITREGLPVVYYKNGQKCPAKTFYDDCNLCFCHDDGNSAVCSRMYCDEIPNDAEHETGTVVSEVQPGLNLAM